jgi:hypothetical protein
MWFYTDSRYPGTVITADMKDAVKTQSYYMVLTTDPWEYDAACAKDPSLPPFLFSGEWFNNSIGGYAESGFLNYGTSMSPP